MHNRIVTDSSRMTQFANICLSLVGVFAATAASYTTIAQWNDGEEGWLDCLYTLLSLIN